LAYHKTGQYQKERILYKEGEKYNPDNHNIIRRKAILSFTEKDTISAYQLIKSYVSVRKEESASEAMIEFGIAAIYSEARILDKAEESYRQASSLAPENLRYKYSLAYFLIDENINTNEGMALADTLLKLGPDNAYYLYLKGWGLYRESKYQEALKILQKSWDIRDKALYDHTAYLHLEEARKALAGLKN
jgi:tetratricopeptide (TPR) repeat protein